MVTVRVGIAGVRVGIFRIPGLGVRNFFFSDSWSEVLEFPESKSELSELGSESEFESETSETGVTLAYLVLAWGLGQSLTL